MSHNLHHREQTHDEADTNIEETYIGAVLAIRLACCTQATIQVESVAYTLHLMFHHSFCMQPGCYPS